MKNLTLLVICFFFLTSCYEDETIIIDENSNELLHSTSSLTMLMRSVMAHDTTKDFAVTKSNCFTINLPYQLKVNGEVREINHQTDIEDITNEDELEHVFPLEVSFVNYDVIRVNSTTEFEALQQKCDAENLNYHKNNCAAFIYPIEVAVYDSNRQRFRTAVFEHDFDGFSFIQALEVGELFSLNYPAEIITHSEHHFTIEENNSLETHFRISADTCE